MGEKLDVEIAATPMPEPYQNKMVDSLSSSSVLVQPLKLFLKICKFIKFSQDAEPACCLLNILMIALQVWILCNDGGKTSEVQFHVVAQKCLNCKSYNTRQTRG
jgi:hypothetical protein